MKQKDKMRKQEYEAHMMIIIIGGVWRGLTAGMCPKRWNGYFVVLKMFVGGQATTYSIENYPGFVDPISGPTAMKLKVMHVIWARFYDEERIYK